MGFQENLRYYRERAGYKQSKDFAQALDIPYSTYKGYETQGREPKYNTLCKIADLLNVSTDELLGRENNILGMNEDERLKKEINTILSMFDIQIIKLIDVTKKYIIFMVSDDKGKICSVKCDKKNLVDTINGITHNFNQYRNENLFSYFVNKCIDDGMVDIEKELNRIAPIRNKIAHLGEKSHEVINEIVVKEKINDLLNDIVVHRKEISNNEDLYNLVNEYAIIVSYEYQLNEKNRLIELKNNWQEKINFPITNITRRITIGQQENK